MARLLNAASGTGFTLGPRVLVGRGPDATLRTTHRRVSSEHAVIAFDGHTWSVRDLGSRNGTKIDGKKLEPGRSEPIEAGALLDFAGEEWRLVDAGPPIAVARGGGVDIMAVDGMLVLPHIGDPRVTVFASKTGRWLAEINGHPRYIADGERIELDGQCWRLELPPDGPETAVEATIGTVEGAPRTLDTLIGMRIAPSLDEESVSVTLSFADGDLEVPSRASHVVLLHLARERRADAARGLAPAEQGWVYAEVLCDAIDVDAQRLNVEVYRARRQLTRLGVAGAAELFERRSQTRQLRLGVDRVEVVEASAQ